MQEAAEKNYMNEALIEARKAAKLNEVPVGAVAVLDNEIIARAHNLVESRNDATNHAEILVIQQASEKLSNWRLSKVDIYVTLEPCPMCAAALVFSRVRNVFFGAFDERLGAGGSLFNLFEHPAIPAHCKLHGGLLAKESSELLQDFFKSKRKQS